jgi:hypothetical protein
MLNSKVNLYTYTASANPYFVVSLAHKFGYEFDKQQPLGSVLEQLVSMEGEPALFEIIENNPDKQLFMEYFEKKYGKKDANCNCGKKEKNVLEHYMNFTGQLQETKSTNNQNSLMVFAGAVLIAFAILSKN